MQQHLIFFQHGLGQKKQGICKTVEKLFSFYKQLPTFKTFIHDSQDIEINLLSLFNLCVDLLQNNYQNIIIGGDHSLAIASVGASLKIYKDELKVLWFDAHADINTLASSPTGNLHGMPLSYLTGLSENKFAFLQHNLNFQNLFYVGIRDLDPFEVETIQKHNVRFQSCSEFNVDKLLEWIGDSPVHLSFDVDGLDPKYISCTGTPVCDGLDLPDVLEALKTLQKKCNIVQVDLVELNLEINKENSQNNLKTFGQLIDTVLRIGNPTQS
jgi:arginase